MQHARYKILAASILNPQTDRRCQWIEDGIMILAWNKPRGAYLLTHLGSRRELSTTIQRLLMRHGGEQVQLWDMSGHIIMPSFVDIHFHWVQDDVRTAPKDNLLEWLSQYTWPHEALYADTAYSRQKAQAFSAQLLQAGTLAGACYSSIHGHAVDHALKFFVGDFVVGNVLMTMNSPAYLSQSPAQAIKLVEQKAARFKQRYAITPRFAPTTHPEVMRHSAGVASKHKLFIQTHLSENIDEISYVLDIYRHLPGFADVKTYSDIYNRCRLLGPRTIMGHAIHLSAPEWKLLARTKTAIAHCPTSNAPLKQLGLGSGLFPFVAANKHKVRWALASDIGGGPFLSMFDVMHSFVRQQKRFGADYTMALYRATRAGAEIMQLGDHGRFQASARHPAHFIVVERPSRLPRHARAEAVLKRLHAPLIKDRSACNQLVLKSFFHGHEVFSRA